MFTLDDARRTAVFGMGALLSAALCYGSGTALYLAPFMASAAVLANAGPAVGKAAVAAVAAYLISIAIGSAAALLPDAAPALVPLLCVAGFLCCALSRQQHPPALALLAVIFLRPPGAEGLAWLVVVTLLLGLASVVTYRVVGQPAG